MRDMKAYGLHDQMMEDFMKVWSNNGLGWQRSKHASVQDPNVIRFMLARLIYSIAGDMFWFKKKVLSWYVLTINI